jgi:NAD(P)-dependent dehydrogenase (short-subunit alcohol dehydrogenase family)
VNALPTLDLTGRNALVIGGAGGGIGSAVSLALVEAGAVLDVVTYDEKHADDLVKEINALGGSVDVHFADVTKEKAFSKVLDQILTNSEPVTLLVNVVGGVGITDWSRTKDCQLETFDRILSRNLRYVLVSCQRFASALIENSDSGSIVNLSSIAARAIPLLAGYGAAKAGLESMSRTMAAEWGQYGIRVNAVAPGTVKTPRAGQSDLEEATQKIPLQRRGEPEDIANAVLFLLSERAEYITGQTLTVDGGATLGVSGDRLPDVVTNPAVREQFE